MVSPKRGRPQLHSDAEILDAALCYFAAAGYEGTSIRTLSTQLQISHNTLNNRFGSKEMLWRKAVDHGFGELREKLIEFLSGAMGTERREELGLAFIQKFLRYSTQRPELLQLMNHEGLADSARLDYLYNTHIEPVIALALNASGISQSTESTRSRFFRPLFFLIVHGATSPLTLRALSKRMDTVAGDQNIDEYIESVSELLMTAIRQAELL